MRIIRFRKNKGEEMLESMKKGLEHFNKALEYVEEAMEESLGERNDEDWDDEDDEYDNRSGRRSGGSSGYRGRGRYARG